MTQVIQKVFPCHMPCSATKLGGNLSKALMAQTLPGHDPVGEQW